MNMSSKQTPESATTEPDLEVNTDEDEDYFYFYASQLNPDRTRQDVENVWSRLALEPKMNILDLACGYGRIANPLAERGCHVTGLDISEYFLELARKDADDRKVEVEYVVGDMRSIPWEARFDRIFNWFVAFGYFEDDENKQVLAQMFKALKPGGRAAIETWQRDYAIQLPDTRAVQRDDNVMVDKRWFDPLTGRLEHERLLLRDGRTRRENFFIRLPSFNELQDWMAAVGFVDIEGFTPTGERLHVNSREMVVTARRP